MTDGVLAFEADGQLVMIAAVQEPQSGFEMVGVGDRVVEKAHVSLETALEVLRPTANAAIKSCQDLTRPPASVELKVGVKLTGSGGIIVSSASAEASLELTLKWEITGRDH